MVHCLGSSLRSLRVSMPLSGRTYLEQIATASPHLESFTLNTTPEARVTDSSLLQLLQVCGGTLKQLAVSHLTLNSGSTAETAQLSALAFLVTHCHRLEELCLGEGVTLSTPDLESLSGSLRPPLRTLSLTGSVSNLGHRPSSERKKRLMSTLVKCYDSILQDITLSESVVWANDGFL